VEQAVRLAGPGFGEADAAPFTIELRFGLVQGVDGVKQVGGTTIGMNRRPQVKLTLSAMMGRFRCQQCRCSFSVDVSSAQPGTDDSV
jgi:hypothetical protein